MNDQQINLIQDKKPQLLHHTKCSIIFLEMLKSQGYLTEYEFQTIQSKQTDIDKAGAFYDIIVKKVNSFEALLNALKETNQSGVVQILQSQEETSSKKVKICRFVNKPVPYIEQFIRQCDHHILLVSSPNCEITCERICETESNCKFMTCNEFLEQISAQPDSAFIPVLNCWDDWESVLSDVIDVSSKMVLVTRVELSDELLNHSKAALKMGLQKINLIQEIIKWDDLTPIFKHQIQTQIDFLGLQKIEVINALETIDTKTIIHLIGAGRPQILRNTIPDPISYYIPRKLVPRHVITKDIFESTSTDIFLFTGLESHELSEMANGKVTDTSSNMLCSGGGLGSKLVILDLDEHFDKICTKFKDKPVHLMKFEEERLVWKKSRGSVYALQQAVEKLPLILTKEDDFLHQMMTFTNSSRYSICISDSAGMGKSVLLDYFGRKMKQSIGEEKVAFVVISEIIEDIKRESKHSGIDKGELIASTMTKYMSDNELSRVYLDKNRHLLKELLLDGLDELISDDVFLGYECLRSIKSKFVNVRLWVTTRPHWLMDLEKELGVLGFNIEAFSEDDQINFLTSYWHREILEQDIQMDVDKLKKYAQNCLTTLKSKISTAEDDIAGIPLQCMLIGDIYETDAKEYSVVREDQQNVVSNPPILIGSMADLYEQLVIKKFQTFYKRYDKNDTGFAKMMKAHIYMSIWLIYPSYLKKFKDQLSCHDFSIQDILNVGILESKTVLPAPRFIHRTFAEYFIARFIVESLKQQTSQTLTTLIKNDILKTQSVKIKVSKTPVSGREFRSNVICYFVDSILAKQTNLNERSNLLKKWKLSKLNETTLACIYNNFPNIFTSFLSNHVTKPQIQSSIFSVTLIKLATLRSDGTMIKLAYHHFKTDDKPKLTDIAHDNLSLLHFAVIQGNYRIFEMLLCTENFRAILTIENEMMLNILHECVRDTKGHNQRILQDKKLIIRYIANIDKNFLLKEVENNKLPIECQGIHIELVKELLHCADNLYQCDQVLSKILQNLTKTLNDGEYLEMLNCIFKDKNYNFIQNSLNSKLDGKPLWHAIAHMGPGVKLLEFLKSNNVDFKIYDGDSMSNLLFKKKGYDASSFNWFLNNSKFLGQGWSKTFLLFIIKNERADLLLFLKHHIKGSKLETNIDTKLIEYKWGKFFDFSHAKVPGAYYNIIKFIAEHKNDLRCSFNPDDIIAKLIRTYCTKATLAIYNLLQSQSQKQSEDLIFKKVNWFIRMAQDEDFEEIAELYFKDITNVETRDYNGDSVLHIAASMRKLNRVQFAFRIFPYSNATNNNNETPMHILAAKSSLNLECFKFLIDKLGDLLILDNGNKSVICKFGHSKSDNCVQVILYFLNTIAVHSLSQANQVLWFTIKNLNLSAVELISECYSKHFGKSFETIVVSFQNESCDLCDAALVNGDGDVLDYVIQHLKCTATLLPETTMHKSCIHNCITNNHADVNKRIKFIKFATGLYPHLANYPNKDGRVPLSSYGINAIFVKPLVECGADVNLSDVNGNTPLHYAVMEWKNEALVKSLIECGADVNAENLMQQILAILLRSKCTNTGLDIYNLLQSENPSEADTFEKVTWFIRRAQDEDFEEIADLYFKDIANVQTRNSDGNSLLHIAAWENKLNKVQFAYRIFPNSNATNKYNQTPMHILAHKNSLNFECFKFLIDNLGDLLILDNQNESVICEFGYRQSDNCVQVILHFLNTISVRNFSQANQVLWYTIKNLNRSAVEMVSECYSEHFEMSFETIVVSFQNENCSLCDAALLNGDGDVLDCVIQHLKCTTTLLPETTMHNSCIHNCITNYRADVNKRIKFIKFATGLYPHLANYPNNDGRVPLSVAVLNATFVKPLVECGADVNLSDVNGNTPLHYAVMEWKNEALVKSLIECGADVNAENLIKQTPLMCSLKAHYISLDYIKILIENKADARRLDSLGNNILHLLPSKVYGYTNFLAIIKYFLTSDYSDLFHVINNDGLSALQLIKTSSRYDDMEILLQEHRLS